MKVVISDYSPRWAEMFAEEHLRIAPRLSGSATIEHIGSTAVPGLAAKPVIDIMAGLADFAEADALVPHVQALGYKYVPRYEAEMPFRRFFTKDSGGVRTHQIHMVGIDIEFWNRHLAFRDYLRTHPETAAEYAALKRSLAERDWDDVNDYADAKTTFIRRVEVDATCDK